jgi:hypothetical protein
VAGYIAKYATKATESFGAGLDRRLSADDLDRLDKLPAHVAELVRACWALGGRPEMDGLRLRAWAHMLGFRGHWSTKSRRYSTTFTVLRRAGVAFAKRRRAHDGIPLDAWGRPEDDQAVIVVASWVYIGADYAYLGRLPRIDGRGTFVYLAGIHALAQAAGPARSLVDALAEAIRQVASLHPGCDLTDPGTPSATMVLLRAHDQGADYLALADAVLLLDTTGGLKVVSDERVNQLAGKEREAANRVPAGSALKLRCRAQLTRALRRARNRPGGYWVAAADPQAASQAVTGSLPSRTLRRAVLLSDGATAIYLDLDGATNL